MGAAVALRSAKPVRALKRGILVMRALDTHGAISLEELNRCTGIAKATLSRILLTLKSENLATQRIADKKWVAGPSIGTPSPEGIARKLLVQVAIPELTKLCRKVIWPSDLAVRSGLCMVLVETSRPETPLMFNKLSVGFQADFLLSATGRAYLAYCPEAERREILDELGKRPRYDFLFKSGQMTAVLESVRERGYGYRDSRWGGRIGTFRTEYDDGLDAIAVPIGHDDGILGCLNITWIRSLLPQKEIVRRNLRDLKDAAGRISTLFDHETAARTAGPGTAGENWIRGASPVTPPPGRAQP